MRALQKAGHTTYLVGGCVRDLLLGIQPKDFDIGTTARPEQIKKLIFRAFIIGKRFRLVLVKREDQQFEVATFRKEQPTPPAPTLEEVIDVDEQDVEVDVEEIFTDNEFGSPEEDARRRDFTINGLFFDPVAEKLIDYADGLKDLEARVIRMIGDPDQRLKEDPIRILRALRLAHMIGFQLEPSLRAGMATHASLLPSTVLPRRREEFLKWLRLADPALAFQEAHDLGILKYLSPELDQVFSEPEAADIFWSHLRHIHNLTVNKQNPTELFGLLVLAFVRARIQRDVLIPLKASEWLENTHLVKLMRDELGMFKSEQMVVAKALHMQSTLQKFDEFAQRGARRQLAVLKNESFPLALAFAEHDFALSPQAASFWRMALNDAQNQLQEFKHGSHRRRRRRKRSGGGPKVDAGHKTAQDGRPVRE